MKPLRQLVLTALFFALSFQGWSAEPTVTIAPHGQLFAVSTNVTISGAPAGSIRFTTDGTDPGSNSFVYGFPFRITNQVVEVRAAVFGGAGIDNQMGPVSSKVYTNVAADGILNSWKEQNFGADHGTDPQALPTADPDGDGENNFQEFIVRTDPRNAASRGGLRPFSIETFAGTVYGNEDGFRLAAKLAHPVAVAPAPNGDWILISGMMSGWDTPSQGGHVRRITPDGQILTLAGSLTPGYLDAKGEDARFGGIQGVVVSSKGEIFVTDRGNHAVRKIDFDGNVTTFAGGTEGHANGNGKAARFDAPIGIAIDAQDNLYVADSENHRVRKITPSGDVTDVPGQFLGAHDVSLAADGTLYVVEWSARALSMVAPGGQKERLPVSISGFPTHVQATLDGGFLLTDQAGLKKFDAQKALQWTLPANGGYQDGFIEMAEISGFGYPREFNGGILFPDAGHHLRLVRLGPPALLRIEPAGQQFDGTLDVTLSSQAPYGDIHYTLDGSVPTAFSPYYEAPIILSNSATVSARLFVNATPVSDLLQNAFSKNDRQPPAITAHPAGVVVLEGAPFELVVAASSPRPMTYQWFRSGAPITDGTNSWLLVPAATLESAGEYYVQVENGLASVTSASATVSVHLGLQATAEGPGAVHAVPSRASYAPGTEVQLRAVPAANGIFSHWSGATNSLNPELAVRMDQHTAVTAHFIEGARITVEALGNGNVLQSPPGAVHPVGTTITLTAVVIGPEEFISWGGSAVGKSNPLTFVLRSNSVVFAQFADIAAPVVTIESPSPALTEDERSMLRGRVNEPAQVEWELNGSQMGRLTVTDGRFEAPLLLKPGINTVVVRATDAADKIGLALQTANWSPKRTVRVVAQEAVNEGGEALAAIELVSRGDVGGMSFVIRYEPSRVAEMAVEWDPLLEPAIKAILTNVPGEIRGTFSLPGQSIPEGTNTLLHITFRAATVLESTDMALTLDVSDAAGSTGAPHEFGTFEESATIKVEKVAIKGDNNGNLRLDIGDATLLQRFLLAPETAQSWDVSRNDLNGSGSLDSGDVIKLLRVLLGMDEAVPRMHGMDLHTLSHAEQGLSLALTMLEEGTKLRADVMLDGAHEAPSGASFKLLYPSSVLRLAAISPVAPGPLIDSEAAALWHDQAGVGTNNVLSFVASSPAPWTNGVQGLLATALFEILPSARASGPVIMGLSQGEVTTRGFDVTQMSPVVAQFTLPESIELKVTGVAAAAGGIGLSLVGPSLRLVEVLGSRDLSSWDVVGSVRLTNGAALYVAPHPEGENKRFYRLRFSETP